MPTPSRTRRRHLARLAAAAALAARCLIAAVAAQRARAQDSGAQAGATAEAAAEAGGNWCARIPPGFAHPPVNLTPVTLQLCSLGRAGAGHRRLDPPRLRGAGDQHAGGAGRIAERRAGRPAGRLRPTGRNHVADTEGRDHHRQGPAVRHVAGQSLPDDPRSGIAAPGFSTRVPGGSSGLMFFDVTYTTRPRCRACSRTRITLASPRGGPGTVRTNRPGAGGLPPAGRAQPAAGRGTAGSTATAAATVVDAHRGAILPINGDLKAPEQFAID